MCPQWPELKASFSKSRPRLLMCHPETAGAALQRFSYNRQEQRRRTTKDLRMRGKWHVRRNLRSFTVLRRQIVQREVFEHEWRLRLSQDDTNFKWGLKFRPLDLRP